eukprot:1110538-Pleurochrysis_carterae.AAC.1
MADKGGRVNRNRANARPSGTFVSRRTACDVALHDERQAESGCVKLACQRSREVAEQRMRRERAALRGRPRNLQEGKEKLGRGQNGGRGWAQEGWSAC